MIRVLHMIASLDVGGSQTLMMNIYRNIDRGKIQFDFVIDHPGETYFAPEIEAMGGRVFTLAGFHGTNPGEIRRDWNNFLYTHPEYRVLHSHSRSYASLYLPVAKRHGLKTIIHSHGSNNGSGVSAAAKQLMQLPLRYQADVLMACSTEAGEWLFGRRACQSERFVFLPNGVDVRRFAPDPAARARIRRELGVGDAWVIGHIGRFREPKNHSFLLDAFQQVHARDPEAFLVLVGVGPLQQEMARKAVALGVADKVLMTGNRDDIPALLSAMDIFAFPSLYEGLPVTLIEAQAAGLPCVITDTITDDLEVTPLLRRLPLGDPALWADALLERRERIDGREALIRAGFDIRASAQKLSELYLRLDREAQQAGG